MNLVVRRQDKSNYTNCPLTEAALSTFNMHISAPESLYFGKFGESLIKYSAVDQATRTQQLNVANCALAVIQQGESGGALVQ
jgi:hypothetical protein